MGFNGKQWGTQMCSLLCKFEVHNSKENFQNKFMNVFLNYIMPVSTLLNFSHNSAILIPKNWYFMNYQPRNWIKSDLETWIKVEFPYSLLIQWKLQKIMWQYWKMNGNYEARLKNIVF